MKVALDLLMQQFLYRLIMAALRLPELNIVTFDIHVHDAEPEVFLIVDGPDAVLRVVHI